MTPYEKAVSEALKGEYGPNPIQDGLKAVRGRQRAKRAYSGEGLDGESALERMFDTLLDQIAPEILKPQGYRGTPQFRPIVGRNFRADRYFPPDVIVEIEGAGHETVDYAARKEGRKAGKGYDAGIEKYNLYASRGFCILRCTRYMLENDPDAFFDLLREALNYRTGGEKG